jgi:glycyl-tRNA synthetase
MSLFDKIVSLCKRRGFIFQGSSIYGGLANSFDYGFLGVELKNNIKAAWWKKFVQSRDDMVGIDAAIIMNTKVWEASGHLQNFTDPLIDCKKCHERFRQDQLPEDHATVCGGELTGLRQFNLMLKTHLGPIDDEGSVVYLRPELAQACLLTLRRCTKHIVYLFRLALLRLVRRLETR